MKKKKIRRQKVKRCCFLNCLFPYFLFPHIFSGLRPPQFVFHYVPLFCNRFSTVTTRCSTGTPSVVTRHTGRSSPSRHHSAPLGTTRHHSAPLGSTPPPQFLPREMYATESTYSKLNATSILQESLKNIMLTFFSTMPGHHSSLPQWWVKC